MKLFFDFFPILLFFAVFKFKGIYFATAAAIIAGVCQLGYMYIRKRKVEPLMWISVLVLALFGGLTILLHNEMFVKWKPTILYWIFAGTLLVSQLIFKKNLIRSMLQNNIELRGRIWGRLLAAWVLFFVLTGTLNLFVAYRYTTAIWVNFKLFGLFGCMLVFVIAQSLFLAPYLAKESKNSSTLRE